MMEKKMSMHNSDDARVASHSPHRLPSRKLFLLTSAALAILAARAPGLVAAQDSDATCYYPNGTTTADDVFACGGEGQDTAHSHCCNQGWVCLSNGLCMGAGGDPDDLGNATLFRGGCTDSSWRSPDCPGYCTDDDEIDDMGSSQPLAACRGVPGAFWCTNGDDDDCDDEEDRIRFQGTPSIMTTIGVSSTTSSSSSSSSSTSTSSSTSSGSSTSTGSSASASASASGAAGGSGDSNSEEGEDGGGGGGGEDTALNVGLGVGIGVGGLGVVLAVVFFILWRRRGRKQRAAAAAAAGGADGTGEGQDGDGNATTVAAVAGEKKGNNEPWSPTTQGTYDSTLYSAGAGSELPANNTSRYVSEASPDTMRVEAPMGDQTLGRAEAPMNEMRYEVPTMEGTQGRHELPGWETGMDGPAPIRRKPVA